MKSRLLIVTSVAYPVFLFSLGFYCFFFVPADVGYAPNPQETFFFQLTTLGPISTIVFFVTIGLVYWLKSKKIKKLIIIIPFLISLTVLFSLLIGILPRGANA
jgi:hypothetical protein